MPSGKAALDWKLRGKGVSVSFGALKEYGGEETALLPMETLLASLAAYSSYDVLSILKKRQKVTGYHGEQRLREGKIPRPMSLQSSA